MVYSDVSLTWSALRFDPGILRSTVGSSVKLFSLCAIVVWLQKTGKLPAATPSVLSQMQVTVSPRKRRLVAPLSSASRVAGTDTAGAEYPFQALVAATRNFADDMVVGVGGFGKVYKVCKCFRFAPSLAQAWPEAVHPWPTPSPG
eukprot:SM000179S03405  [mRNA]  locus=s179:198301:199543:+ [translate_table: standard]